LRFAACRSGHSGTDNKDIPVFLLAKVVRNVFQKAHQSVGKDYTDNPKL
jgi:hypothetical protein